MSKIIRVLAVVLCAVLLCTALVGCASGPKDGTYTARYENASHGYIEYLTVTFKDGAPVEAEYDAYAEGDPTAKKSAATPEEYPMDPAPSEWIPQISANVLAAGTNPDAIDGVAGATYASASARELYAAILEAAAEGNTAEIIVPNEG